VRSYRRPSHTTSVSFAAFHNIEIRNVLTIADTPRRSPRAHARLPFLSSPLLSAVLAAPFLAPAAASPVVAAGSPRPDVLAPAANADSAKKVLGPDDYGRWRTVGDQSISSDGKWVTWVYRFTNVAERDAKPELHVLNLDTNEDVAIPDASGGTFSPDARWIVYQVDSMPPRNGRGGRGAQAGQEPQAAGDRGGGSRPETHHRVELRELATGRTQVWHDMQSGTFNRASTFLLVRNRPAARGRGFGRGGFGGGGGGAEAQAGGSDAILYDLTVGRGQLLGSAGDAAFNRAGDMLAYTVDATVRDGNGLFVVDLDNGATHALDNDARTYARMAWNDAGTGVAVLKGKDVPEMRERDNVLLVVPDVRAALADRKRASATLDTTAAGFPDGWVISERSPVSWSEDGGRVFLGAMPQTPAKDTVRVESSDSTTDVDVWRTADRTIQSEQMIRARRDRDFTYTEAFDVARGAYVALADSTMRELELSPDGRWAVGQDARAYVSDWKPAAADFYRVNTATGERTLMLKGQLTQGARFGISPDGTKYLYWKDDAFHAYDLDRGTSVVLGAGAPAFVDTTYDHPGPRPPWGLAGYTSDGRSVIVEDRYDLWALPLDGSTAARNLTDGFGAKNRTVLRPVRPEPIDSTATRRARTGQEWDLSRPVTLSAFGELTKKAGYYRLAKSRLDEVVYDDAMYDTPDKAARADRYLFTRQTFTESPDLRVSGPDFGGAKRITDANPQQAEYRWGRSVVFDFTDRFGHALQGLLWLPDDYQAGQKRPALVTFYEKQSQILNRYPMPELFVSMGRASIEAVSRGYVVVIPDVWYNTGSSHDDQLDCVEAATRKAIEMGYVDPAHIGLHGHSYGGEGAAYIGTKSRLFAAVGEGAGVVDLYTDFSQEWGWSYQNNGGSGANGNQYYIYDQGRWGASPWEKPEVYRDESALSHAPEVTQPFLIMHGTADPTVSFNESLKFYNALRFNGKTAFLLAYPNEGHHLGKLGNRKDFTVRFYEFFDHYLRGSPAPKWMTDGVPFLKKGVTGGVGS
jgi:dipeptidyl aminopeptidase/acylaminoacyl peptidase